MYWVDPLFIKRREFFGFYNDIAFNEAWSSVLILNSRLMERFKHSNLPDLEFQSLRMRNRFFPECKEQFFAVAAPCIEMQGGLTDMYNNERCFTKVYCDVCKFTYYKEPTPNESNFQDWIRCKDKYKSYRKKNILPKQYVPEVPWFYTPVFQGTLIKPEAMALLYDIDLSYAKITEIEVV